MNTKIHLAAISHVKTAVMQCGPPRFSLESFMDLKSGSKKNEDYVEWILKSESFLLDSGAFSFMNKSKSSNKIKLDDFIHSYINFINKYDIKNFFEMDLDCILPYEEVVSIRRYIENNTHKKTIPVWHKSRGEKEFIYMCDNYEYVAIGGIASREIPVKEHDILYKLCDIAHNAGCRVHGLGYMPIEKLRNKDCPFDTVDGTSWQGHIRGKKFIFEDNKLYYIKTKEYWKDVAKNCYVAWNNFSQYVAYGDNK